MLTALLFVIFQGLLNQQEPVKVQGFPSQTYYNIAKDSSGFIWLGSDAGVFRFDGVHVRQFTPENGLQGNEVLTVFSLNESHLLASHFNSRADLLSVEHPSFIQAIQLDSAIEIRGFVTDAWLRNDTLALVTSEGQALIRVQNKWQEFLYDINEEYKHNRFNAIQKQNNQWVVVSNTGLLVLQQNGLWKEVEVFPTYTRPIKERFTSDFYVITHEELVLISEAKVVERIPYANLQLPINSLTHALKLDQNQWLLASGNNGLFWVEVQKESMVFKKHFLKGVPISGLVSNDDGLVWISTLHDGIWTLKTSDIQHVNQVQQFSDFGLKHVVFKVQRDSKTILIDKNEGLSVFNVHANGFKQSFSFKPDADVLFADTLQNGSVLFGTSNEIYVYTDSGNILETSDLFDGDFFYNPIKSIHIHKDLNELVIASPVSSVSYSLSQTHFKKKREWLGRSSAVRWLGPDWLVGKPGTLGWLKNDTQTYQQLGDYPITYLESIDSVSVLAATNGRGLLYVYKMMDTVHVEPLQLRPIEFGQNWYKIVRMDSIKWIAASLMGWVTITKEANQFNVEPITHVNLKPQERLVSVASGKGEIVITTSLREFSLSEAQLNRFDKLTAPIIASVVVNDNEIKRRNSLVLKPEESSITIDFGSIPVLNDPNIQLQFRSISDNLPQTWNVVPNFTWSLAISSPGNYQFEARLQHVWTEQVSSITPVHIEKRPYWWQQSWLQFLVLMASFSLLFIWIESVRKARVERRVKRLEEKNAMLQLKKLSVTKLLTTHYLFNALTTIRSLALKEDKESVYHYITRFSKLIRALVDRALEAEILLEDELEWIQDYVNLENSSLGFSVEFQIQSDVELDAFKIPAFVLQPIVENALRYGDYSQTNKITLQIREKNDVLVFLLSNPVSSKTVQRAENKTSKGLELTQERLSTWSLLYGFQSKFEFSVSDETWYVYFTIPKVAA